jgi:hypothetical protein
MEDEGMGAASSPLDAAAFSSPVAAAGFAASSARSWNADTRNTANAAVATNLRIDLIVFS